MWRIDLRIFETATGTYKSLCLPSKEQLLVVETLILMDLLSVHCRSNDDLLECCLNVDYQE